jgi:hypothetical protein
VAEVVVDRLLLSKMMQQFHRTQRQLSLGDIQMLRYIAVTLTPITNSLA